MSGAGRGDARPIHSEWPFFFSLTSPWVFIASDPLASKISGNIKEGR
jgi:hypothetical protein